MVTGLAKLRAATFSDSPLLAHLASCTAAVIFDEAHQAVAKTYSFITEQLCSVRPPLLGLTATPGRTAHLTAVDYQLAEMFNHRKVSIDPKGYGNPVTYLIQNRFLADPTFLPISFESETAIPDPESGTDYTLQDLDTIGRDQRRLLTIVELAERAVSRHPRTIVFCPSVRSAEQCSRLLQAEGVAAALITAATPGDERRTIINAFRDDNKDHMVMLNFGVLTAGFDAPRTRCVIIARPTTSLVLYSQMAGRAMRGPRSGGNSKCEIFTVSDTNLPGFGSVTEAFDNWEDLWTTTSLH